MTLFEGKQLAYADDLQAVVVWFLAIIYFLISSLQTPSFTYNSLSGWSTDIKRMAVLQYNTVY